MENADLLLVSSTWNFSARPCKPLNFQRGWHFGDDKLRCHSQPRSFFSRGTQSRLSVMIPTPLISSPNGCSQGIWSRNSRVLEPTLSQDLDTPILPLWWNVQVGASWEVGRILFSWWSWQGGNLSGQGKHKLILKSKRITKRLKKANSNECWSIGYFCTQNAQVFTDSNKLFWKKKNQEVFHFSARVVGTPG